VSVLRLESCFLLFFFFDPNEVIGSFQVEGGELLCTLELVSHFRDEWERVAILDGNIVELTVINAELPYLLAFLVPLLLAVVVLFGHEQEGVSC